MTADLWHFVMGRYPGGSVHLSRELFNASKNSFSIISQSHLANDKQNPDAVLLCFKPVNFWPCQPFQNLAYRPTLPSSSEKHFTPVCRRKLPLRVPVSLAIITGKLILLKRVYWGSASGQINLEKWPARHISCRPRKEWHAQNIIDLSQSPYWHLLFSRK